MSYKKLLLKNLIFILSTIWLIVFVVVWYSFSEFPIWERLIYPLIILGFIGLLFIKIESYLNKEISELEIETMSSDSDFRLKTKYDVFISYDSSGGEQFAEHLWKRLPKNDYTAFFAKEDIPDTIESESDDWRDIIDEAIIRSDYFILIMTIGFNVSIEVRRELEYAINSNKSRIYFKHSKTPHSDLRMELSDRVINLADKKYLSFRDEGTLFIEALASLRGERSESIDESKISERELRDNIIRPIYGDIDLAVRDISEDYQHNVEKWNEIGKNQRLLWKLYDNTDLKNKIERFYSIMMERNDHLRIYEQKAKVFVNIMCQKHMALKAKEFGYQFIPQADNYVLKIMVNIYYKNFRTGVGSVVLHQDILYKKICYSVEKMNTVSNVEILQYLINFNEGKTMELAEDEFNKIWNDILEYSDSEESFTYLRNSVDEILTLGNGILEDILKLKSI